MVTVHSYYMKRIFLVLVIIFSAVGCKEDVEYLPGFTYSDKNKCYVVTDDQKFPLKTIQKTAGKCLEN